MERLAPKPLDRIACAAAPSQRVEGNTLHRSALLGGRYGSEILASLNLGTHLRTGLNEASHTKHPLLYACSELERAQVGQTQRDVGQPP